MQRKKLFLTNCELSRKTRRLLESGLGPSFVIRSTDDVKDSELEGVEIMMLDTMPPSGRTWIRNEKIGKMPNLKFIQSVRAGVDSIDFEQIPSTVQFSGNVGAYSEPMAEHTLGMLLYFAKHLGSQNENLKNGIFEPGPSVSLEGKTLGVVGAGGIGQAVARLARCFGMKTLGVNTRGKPAPHFDRVVSMKKLDQVLQKSDIVVLSLQLNVKTFHIINREKLQLMKRDCILINVARGYVIDEEALYYHLLRNPSFKCALDVWWHYPSDGRKEFSQKYPFFELPNIIGTPHVSGIVPEGRQITVERAAWNVLKFVKRKRGVDGLVDRRDYSGLNKMIDEVAATGRVGIS
ncbi:MAG: 2-hydroxyacid dehydrogenase [Nitrososphaerales archaeon]